MTRTMAQVREDAALKIACSVCTGDGRDCTRVNAICGYPDDVCRVDADGQLDRFVATARERACRRA